MCMGEGSHCHKFVECASRSAPCAKRTLHFHRIPHLHLCLICLLLPRLQLLHMPLHAIPAHLQLPRDLRSLHPTLKHLTDFLPQPLPLRFRQHHPQFRRQCPPPLQPHPTHAVYLVNLARIRIHNPVLNIQPLHNLPIAHPRQNHFLHQRPPHPRALIPIQRWRHRKVQLLGQCVPVRHILLPANLLHLIFHRTHRNSQIPRNLKIRPPVAQPRQHLPLHRSRPIHLPHPRLLPLPHKSRRPLYLTPIHHPS